MTSERPAAVTTMGILNIVFGSLGLLASTCCGIGFLFALSVSEALPGGINPMRHLMDFLNREIPGYTAYLILSFVVSFLLSVLLLTAGIGLLNMHSWGRVLSLICGGALFVTQVGSLIYQLAYVNPAMARWELEMARAAGGRLPPGGFGNFTTNNITTAVAAILGAAYAVVLIVMMLVPHVSAAFGQRVQYRYGMSHRDDRDDYDSPHRRDEWSH
jgi:hypothetical protein